MADLPVEKLKTRCLEYNVLEKMNRDLYNALPIDDLFPSMISNHVIDFNDKAEICAERTERRRVQYFLDRYLSKGLELEVPDTSRFYRFLAVMKQSPKCNFLVGRINDWMERYKEYSAKPGQCDKSSSRSTATATTTTLATAPATGHVTKAPGHVTTTPGHVTTTVGHTTTTPGPATTTTPSRSPGTVIIGGDDCLVTGRDCKKCMKLMQRYIIPKISEEWEAVATFLDYTIQAKNNIRDTHGTPAECCKALLEDWLSSDRGVTPKTWKNLLEAIGEVEELQPVLGEIKQGLQSDGVTFEMFSVEESFDFNTAGDDEEQTSRAAPNIQYHPQAPYYQTTPYTEDPTGQRWNWPPESSIGMDERFGLHGHRSYDIPSTPVDPHRRPMATHPPPAPHNRQPHAAGTEQYGRQATTNHSNQQPGGFSAFIMYSKEENDPNGDQVLCLSNLLNNCGIECDIDLYHLTDDIPDWSFWVGKNVEYHTLSTKSHVILVCSPTMIATLEERNDNACVQMVGGYIDRLTLRHYLQQGAQRVLPLFINNLSADYVPPSLSGKTKYHFPYDTLANLPEDILPEQVLNHPSFTSLRSLIATLTGQPEHVPPGRSQPHAQRPNILRHDHNQPPSTLDQDSPLDKATAPHSYAPGTGEQFLPPDEQRHHHSHHSLPPAAADQSGQLRPQPQRSSARNSPKIMRRDPPSGVDQNVHITAPQSVTPRTAEQAQLYDEQLHRPLLPAAADYHSSQLRIQAQGPAARNNPNILRRNPDLPPSVVDQDVPFDNTTESLVSLEPHSVVLRTMEHNQAQCDMPYGEQVVAQPPMIRADVQSRQAPGVQSSVATVLAEEEAGGTKRPRDYSSSDNDSYYSTPNESPRDGSLVTMSASHHPTQVIPSMNTMPPAEATVCTDQNNSSYYPAFPVQK